MKSLQSALKVLSLFTQDRTNWSVSAIAAELGMGKSHVSKILSALRDAGFLEQNQKTKEYQVGIQALTLASQYLKESTLLHEALGTLRRLTDATGHTSTLCIMNARRVIYLAAVEGPNFLDSGYRVGTSLPVHATAVGKVLAAFQDVPVDELPEGGVLERLTETTITDPERLREHLEIVRREGFARTSGESVSGLGALAVPVFGSDQQVIAAVGLVYPRHVVDDTTVASLLRSLHEAGRTISNRLGSAVYPFG